MGFYRILSASMQGLMVEFVRVEADVSNGLPVFHMVGYLSSEVKEAADRVRAAVRNAGYVLPARKVVVNLSPASVRKRGTSFDLPIAAAVLCALQAIPEERFRDILVIGELGLDGRVRPVGGVLPMVDAARKQGIRTCILPEENRQEGSLVEGMRILGVRSLTEICAWASGKEVLPGETASSPPGVQQSAAPYGMPDFADICGQEGVKRATLVAVAGNHNLLYVGPPGAGKTMLAKRIATILPELTRKESLELTKIYSAMGLVRGDRPLITQRPFREVHHGVTRPALIGGGARPTPGEVTLAHLGVLFLDELAEFRREVLESLRQPLEEKCVHLVRQRGAYCFPADFMLVAAMNPCPCGSFPTQRCNCTPAQIQSYLGKISQPFLDRVDVCVDAPKVEYEALTGQPGGSTSARMREQVLRARQRQKERFAGDEAAGGIRTNAQMGQAQLREYCRLNAEGERLMRQANDTLHLTARNYHRILKVARTIADLDDAGEIGTDHIREALAYRMMDKRYWGR